MDKLDGKTALVTGGTRGIGRAVAERFAAEGARVVVAGRSEPDPPFARNGDAAAPIYKRTDVASAADVRALVAFTVDRFGSLDVLVNNAGVEIEKTIEETTEEEWDWLLGINLKGVFLCCKYALEPMRRGGGSIVNIGSIEGFAASPRLGAYCASKGGVHALTLAIAVDHGTDGIRCNAICPGWIKTDMTTAYFEQLPDPEAAERSITALHPVGRLGRPEDIANMALWLASDESSFATGQLYVLDGGLTARNPFVAPTT
ncbi:MAG: glucose 1-dehydrogenase [Planctomycetota bacterium]|nr:glucose 1-dehydrogenase [Planctomycetota bacterium]